MHQLVKPGRVVFSAGMIALSILCIVYNDFIIGRPPAWSIAYTINPALAYLSALLVIISALAIITKRRDEVASLVIASLILLLSVFRHLPHFMNDWANAYKSMALVGGSLIIAASSASMVKSFTAKKIMIAAGSYLFAAFFIAAAYAHYQYVDFVKTLIPGFIPFPVFWTYFTGVCLLAGGFGLIIPTTRRLAAFMSGIMIAGWFLLLHIPRFLSHTSDASDRMGVCESFTFVGILFVLAGTLSATSGKD